MGCRTGFDMGIYQKLLVVTLNAVKSCPSFKLVLGKQFWSNKKRWIRPVTKSVQSQVLSRNKKGAEHHLEPGTPNISPRSLFWILLVEEQIRVIRIL